jgi:hypothetical protein
MNNVVRKTAPISFVCHLILFVALGYITWHFYNLHKSGGIKFTNDEFIYLTVVIILFMIHCWDLAFLIDKFVRMLWGLAVVSLVLEVVTLPAYIYAAKLWSGESYGLVFYIPLVLMGISMLANVASIIWRKEY